MTASVDDEANDTLTIDVVSDAVCPWCFVGKRRLEAALESLPGLPVEIRWRPFQLDGTIPQGGISREEYLTRKFGAERAKDMYARLEGVGEEAGISFAFDRIARSPNTLDAHRVIRWSQPTGRQDELVERLFNAYFVEGGDIGDRDLLAKIAGDCGLDVAMTRARLDTDADLAEVKEEIAVAQRIGVTGVPFFILGGKYAVAGAQPAEALATAIQKAARANADNAELQSPTA
jgi:predicted DsbA family dithiol-disulfide isomerase